MNALPLATPAAVACSATTKPLSFCVSTFHTDSITGVDGLTAGVRLQDADGLISVTQPTVSHGVHCALGMARSCPNDSVQKAAHVSHLQLLFSILSFLQVGAYHPRLQLTGE